jgi:alpha-tubulin suppressor-like RCC1 family protein
MIAECVLNEAKAHRLRANLEAHLAHSLIVGVAWTEHHSVLAKGDWLSVAIGRDVADRQ